MQKHQFYSDKLNHLSKAGVKWAIRGRDHIDKVVRVKVVKHGHDINLDKEVCDTGW